MGFAGHPLANRAPHHVADHGDDDEALDVRWIRYGFRITKKELAGEGDTKPYEETDRGDIAQDTYWPPIGKNAPRLPDDHPRKHSEGATNALGHWGPGGVLGVVGSKGLQPALDSTKKVADDLLELDDVTMSGKPPKDATEYRNTWGRPLPHGAMGILRQTVTQNGHDHMLVPSLELIAHHQGVSEDGKFSETDCSTRIYPLNPKGWVRWDRGGGLHSIVIAKSGILKFPEPAFNFADAPDGTGWGLCWLHNDGGGANAAMTVVPGQNDRAPDVQLGYLSWKMGGPFHAGRNKTDPHELGTSLDGDWIHPVHLWVDALWYAEGGEAGEYDGPLHFQKTKWIGGGGGQPKSCYLTWRREIKKWDIYTRTPVGDPVPPIIPETPIPPPPTTELKGELTGPNRPLRPPVPGGGGGPPPPGIVPGKADPPVGRDRVDEGGGYAAGKADPESFDPFKRYPKWIHELPGAGEPLRPTQGAPMDPSNLSSELRTPSLHLTSSRARDVQLYDDRYTALAYDNRIPETRHVERHGPAPIASQFFAVSPTDGGNWSYLTDPAYHNRVRAYWETGTPPSATMFVAPGPYLPDGPDDQTAWVGDSHTFAILHTADVTGRLAFGSPGTSSGDWTGNCADGPYLQPDSSGDLEIGAVDSSGAARTSFILDVAGTLTTDGRVNNIRAISTSDDADPTDAIIFVDTSGGGVTYTLPSSPTGGRTIFIQRTAGSAAVTINGNGNNINGSGTYQFGASTMPRSVMIAYDGSAWWVMTQGAIV